MSNFNQTSGMPTKVSKTHQYQNTQKFIQQFRRCWTDKQSKDKLRAFTNFRSESGKKEKRKFTNVRTLIKYRRGRMISCSLIKSTSGPTNSGARTIRLIVLEKTNSGSRSETTVRC
jgi:murein L,D-transpeptidase YafK